MKVNISPMQLALLAGNFIFTATIVTIPQALVDLSMQNTWIIPIFLYAFIFGFVQMLLLGMNKLKNPEQLWESNTVFPKMTAVFLFLFLIHILVRDLRVISGFTNMILLPLTPHFIITLLFVFSILYIAWAGVEVIVRFTELYFIYLIFTALFIPFGVMEQMELSKFQPILGFQTIPSLLQSSFLGLAWVGEIIAVILVVTMVKPFEKAKGAILLGAGISMFIFLILIFSMISVLGAEIVRYSIYPSYQLVQQIRLTEFLDRLDLVLVAFYYPSIFAKMAFTLFGIKRCVEIMFNSKSNVILLPLGLWMGILSMQLFESKVHKHHYETFTWATLGLLLEFVIGVMFVLMIRQFRKKQGGTGGGNAASESDGGDGSSNAAANMGAGASSGGTAPGG